MSAPSSNDLLELDAVEALLTALGPALGGRDAIGVRAGPHDLIELRSPTWPPLFAADVPRLSRPLLLDAWQRVRARARRSGAIAVLVVPSLPETLRQLAEHERINWVDLAGNARVADHKLLVLVEGRRRRVARRGGGTDPFAPRSANVVRQLLADPRRTWRQKELVERTGVSQPQTSKVLAALRELALVGDRDGGRIGLDDAEGLLDAWADAHRYDRQQIVPAHLSGVGMELARDLDDRLRQARIGHWFTGLPAAWAYDRFARFRLVSVFVEDDPERTRRRAGLRDAPRGANVHLIGTAGQRVDIGSTRPDGLPCAHPAQVYVDLLGLPERAREAAERLRPLALSGRAA